MGKGNVEGLHTPKARQDRRGTSSKQLHAPCSLKQPSACVEGGNESLGEEDLHRSEMLNVCCSGFNSLLFVSPPKIRATGAFASPSPARNDSERPQPEFILDRALSKDLLASLERDEGSFEATTPDSSERQWRAETETWDSSEPREVEGAESSGRPSALQNLTNRLAKPQSGEKPQTGEQLSKKPFKFPDGGWVCLACQNYNFCGRVKCNRCGKAKTKDDPIGKPKHLLKKENDENDPTAAAKVGKGVKRPLKERVGDWLCLSCRNLNFAFRKQCNRCKLSKELVGSNIDSAENPLEGWEATFGPSISSGSVEAYPLLPPPYNPLNYPALSMYGLPNDIHMMMMFQAQQYAMSNPMSSGT